MIKHFNNEILPKDIEPIFLNFNNGDSKLVFSYAQLCIYNFETLKYIYENIPSKSFVLYNTFQTIEILFKYLLLRFNIVNPSQIQILNHDLISIHSKLKENQLMLDKVNKNIMINLDNILLNIKSIENDNGKQLFDSNYIDYIDLRYNHKKKTGDVICKGELTNNDRLIIKEIMICIKIIISKI